MKKYSVLAVFSIVTLVLGLEYVQADASYGSIAFSQETDGGYAWGIAWSYSNYSEAGKSAISECRRGGGRDCKEVNWFQNACGSLAIGSNNGYGTAGGKSIPEAERKAIAECSRVGNDNCRIEVSKCAKDDNYARDTRDTKDTTDAKANTVKERKAQCASILEDLSYQKYQERFRNSRDQFITAAQYIKSLATEASRQRALPRNMRCGQLQALLCGDYSKDHYRCLMDPDCSYGTPRDLARERIHDELYNNIRRIYSDCQAMGW